MRRAARLALAAAALLATAGEAGAAPRIGRIQARFYYEETGRLSDNIAPPADFSAWNTIIGEGSAEEHANDLLVAVEVIGDGASEQNIEGMLQVVARGRGGRVIAQRRFRGSLYTGRDGHVWKGLWLGDVACVGRVEIVATIGASTGRTQIG